jgi:hypothetical protein
MKRIDSMCDLIKLGYPRRLAAGFGMDPEAPALKQAEAQFIMGCLLKINAGERDWRAAAWLLETRFPDEYGPNREAGEPGPAMTIAEALKLLRGEQDQDG